MKYNEVLARLQNLINIIPTQAELCKITGVKSNTMTNRATRNSEFPITEINLLNEFYKVNLFTETLTNNTQSSECIAVDYYPDVLASCGNGAYELSQNCIKYDVPATLFPPSQNVKGYSMCHAKGNSMYPRIWDGDFVICEHKDDMKIENGEMYIFCFDDQIYLKRLTKNINQIVVESENPDFPTQYIEKEQMNDVHLIGHVICSGRMNGQYLDKRV